MILAEVLDKILAILFAIVAILLMIVILLQRGRGAGLAGAFGGAGGGTAFGAKTGDVLTWVTVVGAVILLTFTVALNFVFRPKTAGLTPPPPTLTAPAGPLQQSTPTPTPPVSAAPTTPAPAAPSSAAPTSAEPSSAAPTPAEPAPTPAPTPAEDGSSLLDTGALRTLAAAEMIFGGNSA